MKKVLQYVLIFFMAYVLLLLTNPLLQVGNNTYYEEKNHNGYFAIVDEDLLIDFGYEYVVNEYFSPQGYYVVSGYKKTYDYEDGNTVNPYPVYEFVGVYNSVYASYSSSNVLVGVSSSSVNYRFGRQSNAVISGATWIVLDSTNVNYVITYILGVSNYE